MNRLCRLRLPLLLLAGCPSAPPVEETGEPVVDPVEGPFVVEPGHLARVVFVPSEVAGFEGIAVRVTAPDSVAARYPGEALPVVVEVPGGTGTNGLGQPGPEIELVYPGFVRVELILPGGGVAPWISGGESDARGPQAIQAVYDVVRFATGRLALADGRTISDVVGADVDGANVGLLGISNGGNLGLLTAVRYDTGLCWAATWETPIDDTFITVDIGARLADPGPLVDADENGNPWDDMVNPGYVDGACGVSGCTLDVGPIRWDGRTFFRDGNGDGALGNETGETDANGDGQLNDDEDFEYGAILTAEGTWVFSRAVTAEAEATMPTWPGQVAGLTDANAFWEDRAALRAIPDLPPSLPLLVLGTSRDHVQAAATHPHIAVTYEAAVGALDWVRLNPDEAYLRAASGVSDTQLPDVGAGAPLPELPRGLVPYRPKILGNAIFLAGVSEMADRCRFDRWDANLDAVLAPVPDCPNCEKD